jgi:hypothetical protein
MLTCALKTHVKVPKNRNLAFNNIRYIIFIKLNTLFSRKYFYIYLLGHMLTLKKNSNLLNYCWQDNSDG